MTNCAIIGRAEAFASKNSVPLAALDAIMMGLGFMLVLVALELCVSYLAKAHCLTVSSYYWVTGLSITHRAFQSDTQFLLAILPGAFIGLGLLIALKIGLMRKNSLKQSLLFTESSKSKGNKFRLKIDCGVNTDLSRI